MTHSKNIWNLSSRIHLLNKFPNEGVECYVKRDDELGCGISGTKLRKYSSLMPYLIKQGIQHLLIIAGPQSNNLLAALQMAREFNLKVTAFLLKPWTNTMQGNFKLSNLFLNEKDIIWIDRHNWSEVENRAHTYLSTLNEPGYVLNEGASVAAAMPGALSLATDIRKNEQQLGFSFEHIFIDAGTGFSAAALLKGLAELQHAAKIHILLLADTEVEFHLKCKLWVGTLPNNYSCFYPSTAKAFGSLNQKIKSEIKRMAMEEGILADPIYAAKLFHESRKKITESGIQGKILIIHSGGTLTMPGFDY